MHQISHVHTTFIWSIVKTTVTGKLLEKEKLNIYPRDKGLFKVRFAQIVKCVCHILLLLNVS